LRELRKGQKVLSRVATLRELKKKNIESYSYPKYVGEMMAATTHGTSSNPNLNKKF
jgi:hypothetical protein